jgi:protein arginine kinase
MLPGAQLQEAWTRANMVDDALGGSLDYAFDSRFGFLTAGLDCVGSGLKACMLLHLPALALTHQLNPEVVRAARERLSLAGAHPGLLEFAAGRPGPGSRPRAAAIALEKVRDQALYSDGNGGLCGPHAAAAGDLFYLFNQGGLGQPEEEILFQVRHIGAAIVEAEARTRQTLLQENRRAVEDRAGRGMGIATGARLLGFSEALSVLSALRLGGAAGLADSAPAGVINEIMLSAQAAHLEIMRGVELDALTLNAERADLFRARMGRK